ncbi:hypothetical protein [Actinomadura sp. 21ATH]
MSTSLANPRRTRLVSWPSQGAETTDQEQPATSAESAPSAAEEQSTGH